ncbi:MAG: DNA/RNA nuclease SfsA [Cellvibrionaceae bacterium]|nr:DNA/RNA nuclease SfsA [Cellvibrionaceae bacterium]
MKFSPPLIKGHLQRRYKRFLADVTTESGDTLTIHCPNTGAMTNCMVEGGEVWYSTSANPKRKYPNTWEISTSPAGDLVGVNSAGANGLVAEAIEAGLIGELAGYKVVRREVKLDSGSRLDFVLEQHPSDPRPCYMEVKSMTLVREPGLGQFPDAVTERGRKHLQELAELAGSGARAVLFFCVQHSGVERVSVAADIDPAYAEALAEARAQGLELLAYQADISPEQIRLQRPLPLAD